MALASEPGPTMPRLSWSASKRSIGSAALVGIDERRILRRIHVLAERDDVVAPHHGLAAGEGRIVARKGGRDAADPVEGRLPERAVHVGRGEGDPDAMRVMAILVVRRPEIVLLDEARDPGGIRRPGKRRHRLRGKARDGGGSPAAARHDGSEGRPKAPHTRTILPGLRMLSGSSARFSVRMTETASPCSATRKSILPLPMPCSPVEVPSMAMARSTSCSLG